MMLKGKPSQWRGVEKEQSQAEETLSCPEDPAHLNYIDGTSSLCKG